jgi:alpha-amylase
MKHICLYFQVHQPFRLKKYSFFDIGKDHYYYDDYLNESIIHRVAQKCYLPTNKILGNLLDKLGDKFKIAFSISGTTIEQFKLYAPEVIDSFKELAKSSNVEFLAETYSHSLVALKDSEEFERQVKKHSKITKQYFGKDVSVFRNTELIYSDKIGEIVSQLGFKGMLTEGAKHILGWKSPNFVYCNPIEPRLKLLLKNFKFSDDIAFRFSNKTWKEYPLTTEKFATWLNNVEENDEIVNLFMDYETFGEHHWKETGIFNFLEQLPKTILNNTDYSFITPSEALDKLQPISSIHVPYPISWADEERDTTAWLGNPMQEDAFNRLYSLKEKVNKCNDNTIKKDWDYLQTSDHFYYMSTKYLSDGEVHSYFTPYNSPYDAYINYMNILSDFILKINNSLKED